MTRRCSGEIGLYLVLKRLFHFLKRVLSSESWSRASRRPEKRISEAEASPSEIVILVPYKYTFFSKLVISSDCMEGIKGSEYKQWLQKGPQLRTWSS